jgi:predicted acyltransferase
MLLMIFVNDLWTLTDIPGWLEHKAADEDGMGLADVVFPAFLFIVGLSIPWAIKSRISKGQSNIMILRHIIERSAALMIMGLFMVNLEHINRSQLLFSENIWEILMAFSFFLIWNNYKGKAFRVIPENLMKLTGLIVLIFLALTYRGNPHNEYEWMRIHWWGILGLIGWGYLASALVYLVLRDHPGWIALACLVFYLLNINEFETPFHFSLRIVVSASNYASVMSGMLVTVILTRLKEKGQMKYLIPILLGLSGLFLLFGFLTRPVWGISKIYATPSWTAVCAGISTISFVILHIIADRFNLTRWADIISPAGQSTLTCYLVPYYVYPLFAMTGFHLPALFVTGMVGILKSFIFSVLIIMLTGILNRLNISLKI